MIKTSLFSSLIALTVAMAPSHATLRLEESPYHNHHHKANFGGAFAKANFGGDFEKISSKKRKENGERSTFKRAFDHSKIEAPLLSSTEKDELLASFKTTLFSLEPADKTTTDDQMTVVLLESSFQTTADDSETSTSDNTTPLIKINLPKKTRHIRGFNNITKENLVVENTERLGEILQGGYKALSPRGKKAAVNVSHNTKEYIFDSQGKEGVSEAAFLAKHAGLKSAQSMLDKLEETHEAKGKITAITKQIQGLEKSILQLEKQKKDLRNETDQLSQSIRIVNSYWSNKPSSPSPNIRALRHLDSSIKGSTEYNRARRILLDDPGSKEIVPLFKEAIKKNPKLVEAYLELALLYMHRNQKEEADQTFARAVTASTLKKEEEGRLSFNDFRPIIVARYHYGMRLFAKADEVASEGRHQEATKHRNRAIAFLTSAHEEGYAYATKALTSYFKQNLEKEQSRLRIVERKINSAHKQLKQARIAKTASEKNASHKQQKFETKYSPMIQKLKAKPQTRKAH